MGLFRPKAVCLHCAKKVRKPRDPADYTCPHCGQPGPWAASDQVAAWEAAEAKRRDEAQALQQARDDYQRLLTKAAAGQPPPTGASLAETAARGRFTPAELHDLHTRTFTQYVTLALRDDIITAEEDQRLQSLVAVLGLDWREIDRASPGLLNHVVIASANGGLLPSLPSPQLMTKRGETVHYECPASLLKEVALREYRGGYQGFSFPIGKTGIRYRVGGARGHVVTVGTQLKVDDSGILAVSSSRAVFLGSKKTIEMPYSKLVNVSVFSNAIQFHVSNRQSAPLFQVANGEVVAALVHAAVQRAS